MVAGVTDGVRRRSSTGSWPPPGSPTTTVGSSRASTTSARSPRSTGCGRCSSAGSGASAVAVSSNSTTTQPGVPVELAEACLAGDEAAALDMSGHGIGAYAASKLALARWVRRRATTDEWVGAGIRLNAVAPGLIATPMTADTEDMILGLGDVFPIPIARAGTADEVAALLCFLLGPDAGFFVGSVIHMDGGTDARLRADDWPTRSRPRRRRAVMSCAPVRRLACSNVARPRSITMSPTVLRRRRCEAARRRAQAAAVHRGPHRTGVGGRCSTPTRTRSGTRS